MIIELIGISSSMFTHDVSERLKLFHFSGLPRFSPVVAAVDKKSLDCAVLIVSIPCMSRKLQCNMLLVQKFICLSQIITQLEIVMDCIFQIKFCLTNGSVAAQVIPNTFKPSMPDEKEHFRLPFPVYSTFNISLPV